jgi:hypothetical protein
MQTLKIALDPGPGIKEAGTAELLGELSYRTSSKK